MKELFNALKNDIPALSFFCVGAVFALFFLVLSFFYIAKEKKRRNAFDITVTVINIIALCICIAIGLCAIFYAYPTQKLSVSGEYTAAFDIFGFKFVVPGFGAVLKFITTAYGISIYAVTAFALLLFAIIHPLRILRKGAEKDAAGATAVSDIDESSVSDEPATDGPAASEVSDETEDALLDELNEENLSDTIDEIVTRAKTVVSASDDVSPYMINEDEVSGVLDLLSDEAAEEEPANEIPEEPAEESADEKEPTDEIEEETAEEPAEEPADEEVIEESEEPTDEEPAEEKPENIAADTAKDETPKEQKPAAHVSDYVIPVTVRTITRGTPTPKATAATTKPAPEPTKESKTPAPPKAKNGENVKDTAATAKPAPEHVNTKASATPVKEVEAKHVPSLPVGRRYVVQNRRNVVNMFNDYLNSKDKEEKEKLANSLNTIILK